MAGVLLHLAMGDPEKMDPVNSAYSASYKKAYILGLLLPDIAKRGFIDSEEDNTDKIVSHEFNAVYLEWLFKKQKKDGSKIEPEDRLKAEQETVDLMNSMKHEVVESEEEKAA